MYSDTKVSVTYPIRTVRAYCKLRLRRGFSLMEVMIAVVIIGLLASGVGYKVMNYMSTAKVNRAESDIATIVGAVEKYYLDHNRFPSNEQGLESVDIKTGTDPWGRPYLYNSPSTRGDDAPFEVYTLGEDGREGGEGVDADIYSWQLGEEEVR